MQNSNNVNVFVTGNSNNNNNLQSDLIAIQNNGDPMSILHEADTIVNTELSVDAHLIFQVANNDSPYNPPIYRRNIEQFRDDMLERAAQKYDLEFAIECANNLEVGDAALATSILQGCAVYDHSNLDAPWHFYNNIYWENDTCNNMLQIFADVVYSLYSSAAIELRQKQAELELQKDANSKEEAEKTKKVADMVIARAKSARRTASVKSAISFANNAMNLGIGGNEWHNDHTLLGVKNAVIDLMTGKPVMPEPKQYIRIVAPIDYVDGAECPTWKKSITEIFNNDTEKAQYVQRLLGYAMSGECTESDFLIWYGKDGRNGKEYILERVQNVLGETLTGVIQPELLLQSKHGRPGGNSATEGLMALRGRRIAWASETNEGNRMDLGVMKDLSGGHTLTGRHNHAKMVQWKRTHTLFLLTNHLPHVNSQALAEWDRIKVVDFPLSFVNEPDPNKPNQRKKDASLGKRVDACELPGVLNWLLAGCMEWRKVGLQTPESVKAATSKYRSDEDTLGHFINECCVTGDKVRCKTSELYKAYQLWAERNPMGKQTFYNKIEERGFSKSLYSGTETFVGIGLVFQ